MILFGCKSNTIIKMKRSIYMLCNMKVSKVIIIHPLNYLVGR